MGGGGDVNTNDHEYNMGMLTISKEQQTMANKMFNMYMYGSESGNTTTNLLDPNGQTYYNKETGATLPKSSYSYYWDPADAGYELMDNEAILELNPDMLTTDEQVSAMDYQQMAIQSQAELLPYETNAAKAQTELERQTARHETDMLDSRYAAEQATLDYTTSALEAKTPVMQEYYKQALSGVNADQWVKEAGNEAAIGFKGAQAANARSMARYGVNPESGRSAALSNATMIEQAKAVGTAKYGARQSAENINFSRLSSAMGIGG